MNFEFTKWRLLEFWGKLRERQAFADTFVGPNVAAQIRANREARGWFQDHLAQKTGMKQTQISRLENPNYENFTLNTLRRLAEAFDVALMVRFVPFGDFADYLSTLSLESLSVLGFEEEMKTLVLRELEGLKPDLEKLPETNGMPVQKVVPTDRARMVALQGSRDLRQEKHRAA